MHRSRITSLSLTNWPKRCKSIAESASCPAQDNESVVCFPLGSIAVKDQLAALGQSGVRTQSEALYANQLRSVLICVKPVVYLEKFWTKPQRAADESVLLYDVMSGRHNVP